MDIDDILASVDRDPTSSRPSASRDLEELTRFWVAERSAPEILSWPTGLMDRMMERVERQISRIEDLTAESSDPQHPTNANNAPTASLVLPILQTDLSRTQYLLRSLLRARLSKLSKHALHYLTSSNPTNYRLTHLSPQELAFLSKHQELLHAHYGNSFLGSFPAALRRLDDEAGGIKMIEGPDGRTAVFVRCLGRRIRVGEGDGDEGGGFGDDGEEDGFESDRKGTWMRKGEIWVVRWEGVRRGVERGVIELL